MPIVMPQDMCGSVLMCICGVFNSVISDMYLGFIGQTITYSEYGYWGIISGCLHTPNTSNLFE